MTLRHLEIFLTVCRTMSMTKAAEQLNMSQPAVSKAIAELEDFYHAVLFDRIGRRICLSEAGTALKNYADTILSQYDESIAFLRDGSAFQNCRLGVNVTVGETILSDLCLYIEKEVPGIRLRVNVHNSAVIEQQLRDNDCDIAIIDRHDDPAFAAVPLYKENLVFAAASRLIPQSHILREDLGRYRLLLREAGSGNRSCIDPWLQKVSFPSSRIWESSSDEALLNMAEAALGIAVLPQSFLAAHRTNAVHTVAVGGEPFVRRFYLLSMNGKYLNQNTRQCMKAIADFCSCI